MPFKSEAQRRKFWAMVGRGEMKRSVAEEWEQATPKGKKLPERVKHAYIDGLLKAAVQLSKADEQKQMLQFAGLGAAAYPAVEAARGIVQSGKIVPRDVNPKRWLASQMLKGTLLGGAVPAARHFIGSSNIEQAKRRAEAVRTLKQLAPGGVQETLERAKSAPVAKADVDIPLSKVPSGVIKTSEVSSETKRMAALTAFGAGALPAAEAITTKIRTGRFMGGASPKRWLVSQIPQAVLWGAAFPMAGKFIQGAVPMKKTGASKIVSRLKGNLKVRMGRRPMRVDTLLKKEGVHRAVAPALFGAGLGGVGAAAMAPKEERLKSALIGAGVGGGLAGLLGHVNPRDSVIRELGAAAGGVTGAHFPAALRAKVKKAAQSGADLRLPVMGGTKFPTNDSLASAKQTLKEHQDVAKPKMVRPTMQPVYGVNMPKFGSAFAGDPLVQYLKKTAAQVEDNEEDMKTGPVEKERVDHEPEFQRDTKTHSEWRQQLNELFSNKSGIKAKYTDKERSA